MRCIFAALSRIAASDATVLLTGETGTGKGLLAEAIHAASGRSNGPFVVVDCSSIPAALIESELLGHEKGSYTGAHATRLGSFELAQGGTIFLDEIGELPMDIQPKLLRALEERIIRRVGGKDQIHLDTRVIGATNRDLRRAVNEGSFRADLLYRLNTFTIRVPSLRERREDIPQLVEHFHRQMTGHSSSPSPELVEQLARKAWPGNVRELRSAVERNVLVGDPDSWDDAHAFSPECEAHSPPAPSDEGLSFRAAKEVAIARWERSYLQMLTARCGGNLSRAARAANMDRTHLRGLLRRYGIGTPHEDPEAGRDP
jgi:DNA-binding NtrC family response regulator